MKLRLHYLLVLLMASPVLAQEAGKTPMAQGPVTSATSYGGCCHIGENTWSPAADAAVEADFLRGDKAFPNFIGYISNPTKAVDPRSLTQILPIYDYASISAIQRTTRAIGPLAPAILPCFPLAKLT